MKTARKALLISLCAILLVAASVMGTLAYLTSTTKTAVNTFTVGNVSITLDEKDVDDSTANADRDIANEYHLMPGSTYEKDPTVHIGAKSEESYVRMIVTVEDIENLKAAIPGYVTEDGVFLLQNLTTDEDGNMTWNDEKWACVSATAEGVYEFRYATTVANDAETVKDLEALFTHITVPSTVDNEDLAKLANVKINVVAHAIQAEGFADANAAWTAFAAK